MNALVSYSIEVIFATVILGGFYFIFFKNLTFFRFNRFYLLSALVLPLVFPLIKLPLKQVAKLPNFSVLLDEVVIGTHETALVESSSINVFQWLYLGIALIIGIRIISGVISIISVLRKSRKRYAVDSLLYVSVQKVNPFSVFKRIVVSEDTYQDKETLERIVIHEKAHIKQHHGIDLFVSEIICAAFWFNPMVWLLKKELKSTHEYLADEKVLEQDFDLAGYFMLIFDNIVGRNVGLANNFNQSLNLKRMKMMKKKRSSRFVGLASVLALPMIIGATVMLTSQCTSTEPGEVQEQAQEEVQEKSVEIVEAVKEASVPEERIFMVVDKMPSFPGGVEELKAHLRKNVKYPAKAKERRVQARVWVEFIVNKEGEIMNVNALKVNSMYDGDRSDPSINEEVSKSFHLLSDEAKRVVGEMPKWEPGMQNGEYVSVQYRIPINFKLR